MGGRRTRAFQQLSQLGGRHAVITRRAARLSPAVRELVCDLEAHMRSVAGELDRSR